MRKRTIKWFTAIGLVTMLLSGCSLFQQTSELTEHDPHTEHLIAAEVMGELANMPNDEDADMPEVTAPVTLYFEDANGFVAPVTMNIPMTTGIAERALEDYMVDGAISSAEIPAGFTPLLPAGTTVEGMDIVEAEKLAIVDFSREFLDYDAAKERKIVEAVTWMLTGFPTIERVKIRVDGEPLHAMPAAGFPLYEPLTRSIGINLEPFNGVNLASAEAVTLYFKSESAESFDYLVPVTRMIEKSANKAQAVMEQLIAGPVHDGLYAVLAPEVKVLDLQPSDEVVTVDFNEYVLDPEYRIMEDSMQSVILSLTENQIGEQVQIKVNGEVEVLGSNEQQLTQPVARPDHFNIYDL